MPPIFVPVYSEAEEKQLQVLVLAAEIARHGGVSGLGPQLQSCDASAGEIAIAAIEQMRHVDDPARWPEGAAILQFDH